ncbi:hypothetical protein M1M07_16130 [Rhodococcus sp. HM1]|uniref:hypothetical protein n=1 Tax=unclassified Rhodococcus (in: high G+C Gram-positive bacteria) TaxID=192944 RepID=UPI0018CF648A|nr:MULTISPECIES: hypothetical protein [unclassified Rhodococcus (in: high G+C Gram-positive bacteria)]MBH0123066.1 hypothetical protein [Rhodococcus sp. CX]MCK8672625.1 hypothetical protein [Rhodococcus sp. HM1]
MTEHKPDTGQISVAELLARNGKKVDTRAGGRRRRGTSGGISVAELTGEIPVTPAQPSPAEPIVEAKAAPAPAPEPVVEAPKHEPLGLEATQLHAPKLEVPKPEAPKRDTPKREVPKQDVPSPSRAVVEAPAPSAPKPEPVTASKPAPVPAPKPAPVTVSKPEPVTAKPAPAAGKARTTEDAPTTADGAKVESPTEVIRPSALPRRARAHLETTAAAAAIVPPAPVLPRPADGPEPRLLSGPASDLHGTGPDDADALEDTDLIGGAVADPKKANAKKTNAKSKAGSKDAKDSAEDAEDSKAGGRSKRRRDAVQDGEDADAGEESDSETSEGTATGLKQWAMLAGESIAAIVAGALLFKGFERLWDSLPWVAFALALLVIVGLVAVVRILRRTDDITSQLIALAVGAFVTFGPLLFLLPNG